MKFSAKNWTYSKLRCVFFTDKSNLLKCVDVIVVLILCLKIAEIRIVLAALGASGGDSTGGKQNQGDGVREVHAAHMGRIDAF